jgi:Arc/MetJ-type ribon-helix-helix transcriptional regulator
MRSKPKARYQGIALDIPLMNEVKRFIQDKPEYRSMAEFVRASIREKLNDERVQLLDIITINEAIQEIRYKELIECIVIHHLQGDEKGMQYRREMIWKRLDKLRDELYRLTAERAILKRKIRRETKL